MKIIFLIGCFITSFLLYGIYLSLFQINLFSELNVESLARYYDYRGVTNIHSNLSTGSGSYSEILESAKAANLDFIILTEVNRPPEEDLEGYYQNILVLAGGVYSYLDSRILFYSKDLISPPSGQSQAQVFFADLLSQKSEQEDNFLVLAHPLYSKYSWIGEYPKGLRGLEILNPKSILDYTWNRAKMRSLVSLALYPFNSSIAFLNIFSNPSEELDLWDQISKNRPTIGYAGNDTNAKVALSGHKYIKFPSYESSFNLLSNHILSKTEFTGSFESDKAKLLRAFYRGEFYMSLELLGSPKGFTIDVKNKDQTYLSGAQIPFHSGLTLSIELPQNIQVPFQINIIKDGEFYSSSTSPNTHLNIASPGIYRAEVLVKPMAPLFFSKKWIPWIYSNSFYIN